MPLGNPIRKQNESRVVSVLATEGQTVFTVQGGYIINQISVFRNGVRLSNSEDFTAGDGSTVTLNNAANIEDRIEFHIFDRFTVQNAIIGAASTQTINGDLVLNGKLFGQLDVPSINLTGIVTATELDLNGKGDISGDLNVVGVTTLRGLSIFGNTTGLQVASGISTFQALTGTTGTFSGDITANGNIVGDDSTDISGINDITASMLSISDTITHTGDTNTKIRFPAADTFTVETGGSERLRISSSGLVNIGAGSSASGLSPLLHLHKNASNSSAYFHITNNDTGITNNDGFLLGINPSGDCLVFNKDSTPIRFATAGTERLRIASDGNVTIGNDGDSGSNPSAGYDELCIEGGNENIGMCFLSPAANDVEQTISFGDSNNNQSGKIQYEHANDAMHFDTGGSERLRINSSGNVQVNGGAVHLDASGELAVFETDTNLAFTNSAKLAFDFSSNVARIRTSGNGSFSARPLAIYTVNTEALRVDTNAKVLIGTATASSVGNSAYSKFEVSGNTSGATGSGHLSIKRGTATASLSNGDTLGRLIFSSLDGGDYAYIQASVDAAPGSSDYPGRLMFWTGADGSASAVERMRIDSAGQVGINDTSPDAELSVAAVSGNAPHVDIGQAGGNRLKLGYEGNNCFFGASSSTGMMIFKNNVNADGHPQASGTERMRIDGSGRVMINTTTSTSNQSGGLNVFGNSGDNAFVSIRRHSDNASGPRLAMCKSRGTTDGSFSGGTVQSGDILGTIHFYANDSQGFEEGAAISAEIDATPGSNDVPTRLMFHTTPDGSDTKQERMRISASGAVSIGNYGLDGKFLNVGEPSVTNGHSIYLRANTSSSYSNNRVLNCDLHGFYRQSYGQTGFRFRNKDSVVHNRSARVHLYLNDDDTEVGSIMLGASSSAFNTSSDYRLKENEVLISDGITRLKQLKPYRFNFKITPSVTQDGFFAHEVSPVVPEAVTGEKDAMAPTAWYQEGDTIPSGKSVGDVKEYSSTEKEIQSLDYAKITPLLTAALQEAIAKIETLEAKVAALEGS